MKQLVHPLLILACALPLASPCLAAQDPAPSLTTPSATERYDALEQEVQAAYSDWVKDIRARIKAAEEKGEELPQTAYTPPFKPFVVKFQAAAQDYAKTDDAVPFLAWLAQQGMGVDEEAGKQAVMTLIDDHLASEEFAPLAGLLPSLPQIFEADQAATLIAKVEQNTKDSTVRAWAVLARLSETLEKSALGSEAFEAAKKEMRSAMEGVDDRRLVSEVAQKIDVRETFGIGVVAPEIEGLDLDGAAFKLSDYKGKVVFLDFWGDW